MKNKRSEGFLLGDFFKLSDNVMVIIDTEGWFVEINPACIAVVGYSPEEIIGKSIYHFAHPDDLSNLTDEFSETDRIKSSRQVEYRWHCKDSSWARLRMDIQLIPEEGVFFVIGREMTDEDETRKKALDQTKNILDTIIESIPAMIFMKSAKELRFERFNRGGELLLGISREDLLGKNDYDLFTKEQADFFTEKDRGVLNSHEVLEILEEPIQTSSGETIYLRTAKVALRDADETPTHLLGISIDITERRHAENQLRQVNSELSVSRAEAEQANRAKSDFLANMSHEIRTPMNGVIGMTDVLRETRLSDNQEEMVDLIQDSALSLLRIIDDILDLSKIEAGQFDIDIHPFNLIDSVDSVCAMLNNLAQIKNVVLTVFVDPELSGQVMGDSLRLRQVFINLINNAIKFSSTENQLGCVSVRASLLEQSSTQFMVEFLIEDNGIGMDKDTQARLFTAFMQKDSSTCRVFGGTGLGLVITHNLVKLMGGEITVQSSLHKGSSFRIQIPFALAPAVLVVEDCKINQKVILRQLALLGYNGHATNSGHQALEGWRNGDYALLLTDLQMPDMNGYELCAAIRAEEKDVARIPIILQTANVLANTDEEYAGLDIDGFLNKPARLEELQAIIGKWIDQKN